MTRFTKSLCWASAFIFLALANRAGLIADKDASVMFAVIPALWAANGALRRCALPGARA